MIPAFGKLVNCSHAQGWLYGGSLDNKTEVTLAALKGGLGFSDKLRGGSRLVKLLGLLARRYGSLAFSSNDTHLAYPEHWSSIADDLIQLATEDKLPFPSNPTELPNELIEGFLQYERRCDLGKPTLFELLLGFLFWRLLCEACDDAKRADSTLGEYSTHLRLAYTNSGVIQEKDYRTLLLKDFAKEAGKYDIDYAARVYKAVKNYRWPDADPGNNQVEFRDSILKTFEFKEPEKEKSLIDKGDPKQPKVKKRKRKKKRAGKSGVKDHSTASSRRLISSGLKVTANSTVIMTPLEKGAFLDQVNLVLENAESGKGEDVETWVLILASYLYGKDFDHWFEVAFEKLDSIDKLGNFLLPVYLPEISTKLFTEYWTAPVASFWLTANDHLRRLLNSCDIGDGKSIAESLGLERESTRKRIRNLLARLRAGGSLKITPSMIVRQREVHLSVLTESPLLTYLLIGDSAVRPPVGAHYQYIAIDYLQSISKICFNYLLDGSVEGNPNQYRREFSCLKWDRGESSMGYTGFKLDNNYLESLIERLVKKTRDVLASSASIIVKHNAFADYVYVRLMFGQGLRPVRDPFPRRDWLSDERGIALHQDKSDHFGPAFRISCLTDADIDHIAAYDSHLVGLASRLFQLGDDYGYVSSVIYTLARGLRPAEPVPYLFRLSDDGMRFISYRSEDFVRILNASTYIPQNFPRKWLYTALIHEGVPDVVIRSIMGHATTSANLLGRDSFYSLQSELALLKPVVELCVDRLGWQYLQGLGKYGESNLKIKRDYPVDFSVAEFKRLGYEQRIKRATRFEAAVNRELRLCEEYIERRLNLSEGALRKSKNYTSKSFRLVSAVIKGSRKNAKSDIHRKRLCNPPENPERLLVENSIKLKERSFLCGHQDTATARYWRF